MWICGLAPMSPAMSYIWLGMLWTQKKLLLVRICVCNGHIHQNGHIMNLYLDRLRSWMFGSSCADICWGLFKENEGHSSLEAWPGQGKYRTFVAKSFAEGELPVVLTGWWCLMHCKMCLLHSGTRDKWIHPVPFFTIHYLPHSLWSNSLQKNPQFNQILIARVLSLLLLLYSFVAPV